MQVHKLEFLALKWAVTDKFHEYLYGSEFQVYIDNNPLTYVLTTAKLDATGHRWVAALSDYTFSIIYTQLRAMLMQMHYPASGGLKPWNPVPWSLGSGCIESRKCTTWHDTTGVVSSPIKGPSHPPNH